jgi:UDP-N-acetylglucosamine--N-acetylmuramyl-(pentapeptide) pyrophosphoryl-undecaprenol N-acetylglucosamine transferase
MSFAIAAAGTGGHVFPGLAVGEALVASGVPADQVLFVGGGRLEAEVYPEAGFPFLGVELRGLRRSFTVANLGIPRVVMKAAATIAAEFRRRTVRAVLGMGGYVTIPAAWAARMVGARLAVSEQNAEAGLANAVAGVWAERRFGAFPRTARLRHAEWVGNPVRAPLAAFDRAALRARAYDRYRLDLSLPVLGVFGGSLGAGVLNAAVERLAARVPQIVHLAGSSHADALAASSSAHPRWRVVGFEDRMDLFYAASDLVLARAGGAVAELAVTSTPSVLVPGGFGSGRHQVENAAVFARTGAAVVVEEADLGSLDRLIPELLAQPARLQAMAAAAGSLARPTAAAVIAAALRSMHG